MTETRLRPPASPPQNTGGIRRLSPSPRFLAQIGRGRPKGKRNKVTQEIRALVQALFDEAYWSATKDRLLRGTCPPAIEAKLLAYAYGEPKHVVDVGGLKEARPVFNIFQEPGAKDPAAEDRGRLDSSESTLQRIRRS